MKTTTGHKAFTLIEIIMVLLVVSLIAGFGIPNYPKLVAKAKARDAINNMTIIHAANKIYKARKGINNKFATIADIDTNLYLNIRSDGASYSCNNSGPDRCVASSSTSGDFTVTGTLDLSLTKGSNPSCTGTYCP